MTGLGHEQPSGSVQLARRRRPHCLDRPSYPHPKYPTLVIAAVEQQVLQARSFKFSLSAVLADQQMGSALARARMQRREPPAPKRVREGAP